MVPVAPIVTGITCVLLLLLLVVVVVVVVVVVRKKFHGKESVFVVFCFAPPTPPIRQISF